MDMSGYVSAKVLMFLDVRDSWEIVEGVIIIQ